MRQGESAGRCPRPGSLALLASTIRASGDDDQSSVFGQSKQSEAAFMGVLYDLKQTQDRKPTNVDPNTYSAVDR